MAGDHVHERAINHAIRKSADKFQDIKHFTPHDLRRTVASHMTAMGIPRLIVSKILNHVENSVTAIYDRHSYDSEKKDALEKWGNKLSEIIKSNQQKPPGPQRAQNLNLKLKITSLNKAQTDSSP